MVKFTIKNGAEPDLSYNDMGQETPPECLPILPGDWNDSYDHLSHNLKREYATP